MASDPSPIKSLIPTPDPDTPVLDPPILQPPPLSGLQLIARPTNPSPLDPNGVDVYGELPYMRSAYALTANGQAQRGTQEAMYAIIKNQDGPSRTKPVLSGNRHDSLTVPARTMAVVHTHPQSGNPQPSEGDMATAKSSGIPDYVYSARNGGQSLYAANPDGSTFQYNVDSWNQGQPSGFAGIRRK